jgi:hypothetical protein
VPMLANNKISDLSGYIGLNWHHSKRAIDSRLGRPLHRLCCLESDSSV